MRNKRDDSAAEMQCDGEEGDIVDYEADEESEEESLKKNRAVDTELQQGDPKSVNKHGCKDTRDSNTGPNSATQDALAISSTSGEKQTGESFVDELERNRKRYRDKNMEEALVSGTAPSRTQISKNKSRANELFERKKNRQFNDGTSRGYSHEAPNSRVEPRKKHTINAANASYGVYIPPFKRKVMEQQRNQKGKPTNSNEDEEEGQINQVHNHHGEEIPDIHDQRQNWESLKKSIHGTINRINVKNIKPIIHSLFQKANLIRGKGLLSKAIIRASITSPSYSHIYAALVAVLNTKLPELGELILIRLIFQFKRGYGRQDKNSILSVSSFIGHLFNQGVCHELLILQILTILLEGDPTDDSVDVAVSFTKVVGMALTECSPAGIHAIMERFRALLHDGTIGKRIGYKIEELIQERKKKFENCPSILEELDLVETEDQITLELSLDDEGLDKEESLDVFYFDENFIRNEDEWSNIQREILGSDEEDEDSEDSGDDTDKSESDRGSCTDEDSADEEADISLLNQDENNKGYTTIHDFSEADLVNLRRTIYLTIMSSATFEECTHKLTKINIPLGQEIELVNMLIECCSQERTFLRYYGLIASRFCLLHERWSKAFEESFKQQYITIHRLETNKLRNVAKLFAHLIHTDSLPWSCLSVVHLNEDDTTSSSRIFLKILVQEIAEALGILNLVKRFDTYNTPEKDWCSGLFPRDDPRKTRYAINFFTTIGLGPLTDKLREHLKNAPKLILSKVEEEVKAADAAQNDSSSVSSSSLSSYSISSRSSYSSNTTQNSLSSSSYSSYSSDSLSRRSRRKYQQRKKRRGSKSRSRR